MNTEGYTVEVGAFRGPLELLLSLIEKRKLLINDVSLARVTDDYMSYAKSESNNNVGNTANFIVVASTLLLIKSKSLLPTLELTEEEEGSIEDLERRLKLYKKFRDISKVLGEQFCYRILFSGGQARDLVPVFAPSKDLSQKTLLSSMHDVLKQLPKKELVPEAIVKKVISLEEMIEKLAVRMKESISTSFKEFAGMGKNEKVEVIVGFLAMLELVKQGIVQVSQDKRFSDITIESEDVSTPSYS